MLSSMDTSRQRYLQQKLSGSWYSRGKEWPFLTVKRSRALFGGLAIHGQEKQRRPIPEHIHIPPYLDRVDEPSGISNDMAAGVGPPEDLCNNPEMSRP